MITGRARESAPLRAHVLGGCCATAVTRRDAARASARAPEEGGAAARSRERRSSYRQPDTRHTLTHTRWLEHIAHSCITGSVCAGQLAADLVLQPALLGCGRTSRVMWCMSMCAFRLWLWLCNITPLELGPRPDPAHWNQRVTSLGDRTNTRASPARISAIEDRLRCYIEDLKEARANENTHVWEPGSRKRLALACSGRDKQ